MKVYNKLVRDKIPQVIAEEGNQCDIEIASKEDMISLLGYSEEELVEKRNCKLNQRGGFKEGIVLKSVK